MIRIVQGLMEIARLSMSDAIFDKDHRVKAARKWMERHEWSGEKYGQGFGPHGSGGGGTPYPACPECGGLQKANNEFIPSTVGHRSGCAIADVLKRPTYVEPGETGELSL